MAIIFDIGKTNMRVAFTGDGREFEKPLVAPTPNIFDEAIRVFVDMARTASLGRQIDVLSGGLPGTLNEDGSGLLFAPEPISDWAGKSFRDATVKELGGSVMLSNDAVLVALGEALHGAGKGHEIVGYFTFSTGIGGARISHGKADQTAFGFEPGKLVVPHLGAGMTAEDFASGSGLERRFKKPPYEIHDDEVWSLAAKAAAFQIHAATLFWSPHIMVVGGPMLLGDPAIPFEAIRQEAAVLLGERRDELRLEKATLQGFGGLWGALAMLSAGSQQ